MDMIEGSFDAVYYPGPAPESNESLTVLALVFDKIYFPGVHVPLNGIDQDGVMKRIIHLRGIDAQMRDETLMHVNLLTTALYGSAISSFCEFPDNDAVNPNVGPDAERLGMEIEQLYFGPPA